MMLHFGVSRSVYLDQGAMLGSGLGIKVEVWVLLDTKPPSNLVRSTDPVRRTL